MSRWTRFLDYIKPTINHNYEDKEKAERIEELVVQATLHKKEKEQWIDERSGFIKLIRDLNRRVDRYEMKIERLYDAVFLMKGSVELDSAIERQVDAKLK